MSKQASLEGLLRDTAARFRFPATPDLRAGVLEGIEDRAQRRLLPSMARLGTAALLMIIVLVAAIPGARAAVRAAFRIGVVTLLFEGDGADVQDPDQAGSGFTRIEEIAGGTTLADARNAAPFEINLPEYTAGLGGVDSVYFQESLGPMVVLVWLDDAGGDVPAMSLHILGDDAFLQKLEPQVLAETRVGGQQAAWTQGPYLLRLTGGETVETRVVRGRVLIWSEGGLTYRLESGLSLEEARRVAESIGEGVDR